MTTITLTEVPLPQQLAALETAKPVSMHVTPQGLHILRFAHRQDRDRLIELVRKRDPRLGERVKPRLEWGCLDYWDYDEWRHLSCVDGRQPWPDEPRANSPEDLDFRETADATVPEDGLPALLLVAEAVVKEQPSPHDLVRPLLMDGDWRTLDPLLANKRLAAISRKVADARDDGDMEAAWGFVYEYHRLYDALRAWKAGALMP
jgi:hypothetical protein